MDMEAAASRLYRIRNIANLAAMCPENKAEAYLVQDAVAHVSEMVQDLIEDIKT
jgi:hypothetical protein